jgi:ABC-type lipoprotein release transport system permease subunit
MTRYSATAGGDSLTAVYGTRMLAVFSVVTLLTIAVVCANVANLLIARAVVRQRELALRQPLASPPQVVASVVGESFRLTGIGLVVGFALSVVVATLLSRFLFGITPTDPPTYLGVFALLTAASLAACYLPARRAGRTDPTTALRTE